MTKHREYHPPLTALDARMEEEIARDIKPTGRIRTPLQQFGKAPALPIAGNRQENDRAVEEAMQLGQ